MPLESCKLLRRLGGIAGMHFARREPHPARLDWRRKMKRTLFVITLILAAFAQQTYPGANRGTSAAEIPPGPGIISVNITAKKMLWDPSHQRLLAHTSSPLPPLEMADFIAIINPQTGAIEQTFQISGSPMAVSDNGEYLYTRSMRQTQPPVVQRYRMADHSLNLEINLGANRRVIALAALPGRSESFIVATGDNAVTVYDGAKPRSQSLQQNQITEFYFRPSDKQLFGLGGLPYVQGLTGTSFAEGEKCIFWLDVNEAGVHITRAVGAFAGDAFSFGGRFVADNTGDVFDLDRGIMAGKMAVSPFLAQDSGFQPLVDPSGALFGIFADIQQPYRPRIVRYSTDRFIEIADLQLPIGGMTLVWDDGIAIASGKTLYITSQRNLVERPATPLPAPKDEANGVIRIPLRTNGLVYNQTQRKLAASIPGNAGTFGNSVVFINPANGNIGTPIPAGSEPSAMAFSEDGNLLYVASQKSPIINLFNTKTEKVESTINVLDAPVANPSLAARQSDWRAAKIVVLPNEPQSVAVLRSEKKPWLKALEWPTQKSYNEWLHRSVAIFDKGLLRSNVEVYENSMVANAFSAKNRLDPDWIILGDAANTLIAADQQGHTDLFTLDKSGVRFDRHLDATGMNSSPHEKGNEPVFQQTFLQLAGANTKDPRVGPYGGPEPVAPVIDQGRIFTASGCIWAADRKTQLGCVYMGGIPLPDNANRRVFYIKDGTVVSFDTTTFQPTSIGYVSLSPWSIPQKGTLEPGVLRNAMLIDGKIIAMRTDNEVILYPISAMKPWDDKTKPGPDKSGTQLATAAAMDELMPGVRRISLTANDLFVDADGKLIASTPASMVPVGNSIMRIDPKTGSMEKVVFIGSEPSRMALTPDGNSAYVWLEAEGRIGRFNLRQGKRDLEFTPDFATLAPGSAGGTPFGAFQFPAKTPPANPGAAPAGGSLNYSVDDMAVNPVTGVLAISVANLNPSKTNQSAAIALYEEGKQLPSVIRSRESMKVFFDKSGKTLYGYNSTISKAIVTKDGLDSPSASAKPKPASSPGGSSAVQYDNGLVYTISISRGVDAIDPELSRQAGKFVLPQGSAPGMFSGMPPSVPFAKSNTPSYGYAILADSKSERLYELGGVILVMFDMQSRAALGVLQLPTPTKSYDPLAKGSREATMVKLDADTIAIRTNQEIFIVRTAAFQLLDQPRPSTQPK
jgi:YVTN family beta-propeller protein